MTTDRQLLEDAARAAGLPIVGLANRMVAQPPESKRDGLVIRNERGGDSLWNPLRDDGDALRLASKLKIDLIHDDPGANDAFVMAGSLDHVEDVDGEVSRPAAVRRAIVRAAAAIGRQKEAE